MHMWAACWKMYFPGLSLASKREKRIRLSSTYTRFRGSDTQMNGLALYRVLSLCSPGCSVSQPEQLQLLSYSAQLFLGLPTLQRVFKESALTVVESTHRKGWWWHSHVAGPHVAPHGAGVHFAFCPLSPLPGSPVTPESLHVFTVL